jgi:hypothetical protein
VHVWYDRERCSFGMKPLNIIRVSRLLGRMIYIFCFFCISVNTFKEKVQSEVLVPTEEVIVEFVS